MAKVGIRYAVFGVLDEKTGTYSKGANISPVAGYNGTPTASDVTDYGDDRALESDQTVTGGSLSVELNRDDDQIYSLCLGHKVDETTKEITYSVDDVAPYMGTGAIGRNSDGSWVAKFYTKVKFKEPNDENSTKQENTTFNHATIEGNILIPENGVWKKRQTFKTEAEAKEYLNKLVGITTTSGT